MRFLDVIHDIILNLHKLNTALLVCHSPSDRIIVCIDTVS